jgi:sugar/nucleoside kinase (ribokinase family)
LRAPVLACLGDLTLDVVVRADDSIDAGTDVPAVIRFRPGGSAANAARSFAQLGGKAVFIGAIGEDEVGTRLVRAMRSAGVIVHAVRRRGHTARLVVVVGRDGERSFLTDRGVADGLTPRSLKKSWLTKVDALHVPAYSLLHAPLSDAAFLAIERARTGSGLISVDLASQRPLLSLGRGAVRGLFERAAPDILFANQGEAAVVAGRVATERLLELAPIVVVKQGAIGCRVLWRSGERGERSHSTVATTRIAATDTTGAGDAFDAGFLKSLLTGGYRRGTTPVAADLRRAALAGHRSAAKLLTSPRRELSI